MRTIWNYIVFVSLNLLLANSFEAHAQTNKASFSDEQLDQMLAPIALYPDSLLSQIFMASTYPADVASAAKWSKANPNQKGDEAVKAVGKEPWDPSVQSLVAFPQVLAMMDTKPDWVQSLGDAFLAAPDRVMDRVQFLRKKASDSGNLKSNEQQKVIVETPAPQETIIKIEPAQPQVVYVPTYNPTVVYGSWWWPAYPPYYMPPPPGYGFASGIAAGIGFGVGIAITDSLWGDCDWGGGDVDIDVNKYNNINVNNKLDASNRNQNFQHNANNRKGVPYRDSATSSKYGKTSSANTAARQDYRGQDNAARDAQRNQASQTLQDRGVPPPARNSQQALDSSQKAGQAMRDNPQVGNQAGGGAANRAGGAGAANQPAGGAANRSTQGVAKNDNAFSGAKSPAQSHQATSRGQSSRPSGGGGGGFQGGGGGRSGGGGRGGGGRR